MVAKTFLELHFGSESDNYGALRSSAYIRVVLYDDQRSEIDINRPSDPVPTYKPIISVALNVREIIADVLEIEPDAPVRTSTAEHHPSLPRDDDAAPGPSHDCRARLVFHLSKSGDRRGRRRRTTRAQP